MSQREQELKNSLWQKYGGRFGSRVLDVFVKNGNGSALISRVFVSDYECSEQLIADGWSHGEETVFNGLHVFPVAVVNVTEDPELDSNNFKE